ncbi:hypothetical protein AT236_00629 [Lactobacillus delbrueckii subsp. bulgaricus]|nr:hypothetical protein AT236_00629 [Lactobacillus delbrueckii subsp. bulgaricus]
MASILIAIFSSYVVQSLFLLNYCKIFSAKKGKNQPKEKESSI